MVDTGTPNHSVELSPNHGETLRKFLLGESNFPSDVGVIVTVCIDKGAQGLIFSPAEVREATPEIQFSFAMLGIEFRIIFDVPFSKLDKVCCVHSQHKVLFARNCHKEAQHGFNYLTKAARVSEKVRRKT